MKIVSVPYSAAVLVVEDSISRRHWFLSRYRVPGAFLAGTPEQANRIIHQFAPNTIFLDYDLAPGVSSEPVAQFLSTINYGGQVYIHSANPFGSQALKRIFPNADIIPFGTFEVRTLPSL